MLKAHRRFPRVKEKLPRQPDKQHGRATTKGYSYYSIARNEKKGAYTMSTNEMTSKSRELKELKAMAEDLAAEITAIEDTIKAEMTARNTDEMTQETISKAKAAQLFAENAVLFGRADGVPEQAATELFGSSAVAFAKRQQNAGTTFNGYGIGDYTAWYLTEYGFYIAATYRNVERIREGDGWNE